MSERLTDEELADLHQAVAHDVQMGHECVLISPPDLLCVLSELRTHRAAALTDEEREALLALTELWRATGANETERRALAVLDKLLGGP
jgi:hypothetical protein